MNDTRATWIIVTSGERRRMLHVDGRSGQIHRVFEETDEVWHRLDLAGLLAELMLDPANDRLILVASPEELAEMERGLDDDALQLVGLRVDRDLYRVADPLVVHVVREMVLDPTRTLPSHPCVAPRAA